VKREREEEGESEGDVRRRRREGRTIELGSELDSCGSTADNDKAQQPLTILYIQLQ